MVRKELLQNTTLAVDLTPDQLEILCSRGEERLVPAGGTIVSNEDTESPLMVLLSGQVDVLGVLGDVVNRLEPGVLIGEVSFIDKGPRSATAVAKTDAQVAVYSEDLVSQLGKEHPTLVTRLLYNISRELCKKLRQATRAIDAGNV